MSAVDHFPRIDLDADEPEPEPADDPSPPRSAFRATALLMAVRDLRANPGASWLLVALVAVPVMLATAIGVGATALPRGLERAILQLGEADARADIWLADLRALRDDPEAVGLDDRFREAPLGELSALGVIARTADLERPSDIVAVGTAALAERGATRVTPVVGGDWDDVVAADVDSQLTAGIWRPREGRGPASSGEAALTSAMAEQLDSDIGDTVVVGGMEMDVVGVVDVASDARRRAAIVSLDDADRVFSPGGEADLTGDRWPGTAISWYVTADEAFEPGHALDGRLATVGPSWGAVTPEELGQDLSGSLLDTPAGVASMIAVVALAAAGLVAAAVWQTRVRRRLRTLGLLLVNGATDRQIRRAVTSEALAVGLLGSVAGAAVGVTMATVLATRLIRLTPAATSGPVRPTAATLLLPMLLGIAGSLAAAWLPAQQATRVTPQQALAGRVPSRPVRRRTLTGAVVVLALAASAAAALVGAASSGAAGDLSALAIALAFAAAFAAGAVLVLPAVRGLGEHAPLASVSRIALRDASRQIGRTGAAIAVVAAVLVVPVGIGLAHSANLDDLADAATGPRDSSLAGTDDDNLVTFADAQTVAVVWPPTVTAAGAPDPIDQSRAVLADRGVGTLVEARTTQLADDVPRVNHVGNGGAALVADPDLRPLLTGQDLAALDAGQVLAPPAACDDVGQFVGRAGLSSSAEDGPITCTFTLDWTDLIVVGEPHPDAADRSCAARSRQGRAHGPRVADLRDRGAPGRQAPRRRDPLRRAAVVRLRRTGRRWPARPAGHLPDPHAHRDGDRSRP